MRELLAGWGMFGQGLPLPLPPVLIIVAIGALALFLLILLMYLIADRLLLRWYHARKTSNAHAQLHEMVHRLASKAGIPEPGVFIVDSAMPNAFVAGRSKRHASVVLTTGLIDLLDDEEMEAVLAYELTHINIKNSSIGIVTFSGVLAGMLIALANLAFWGAILTGFGQEDDPAPQLLKFFVTALVAPIAATIIQLTTRHRHLEYQTDEQSVLLHGKPDKLACALRKIEEHLKSHHFEVNPAHAHLFIVNPLHDSELTVLDFRLPCYHFLFRTQPATEERVKRLLKGAGVAGAREEGRKKWRLLRPLSFSFIAYLLILFLIIVLDTFNRKDFIFKRAAIISAVYIVTLSLTFIIMLVVFRVRLK
ncbi:MAG: hypothetical protein C4B56_05265 [Candidatus Methanophagaceae archaeon]|nr:MAG: hypothetical protein C4B56_05265 [Methanophagales archaeon]